MAEPGCPPNARTVRKRPVQDHPRWGRAGGECLARPLLTIGQGERDASSHPPRQFLPVNRQPAPTIELPTDVGQEIPDRPADPGDVHRHVLAVSTDGSPFNYAKSKPTLIRSGA